MKLSIFPMVLVCTSNVHNLWNLSGLKVRAAWAFTTVLDDLTLKLFSVYFGVF